jgi:cytosine deaminase
MVHELVIRGARIAQGRPLQDIGVDKGKISAVGAGLEGDRLIDVAGDVVVPSFVESHIHIDKALLERIKPNVEGTLMGAIKNTGELKKQFREDEVLTRSRKVMSMLLSNGTTIIRAQPDTDPLARLEGFRAMLRLREEFKDYADMQVTAFAQEGIIQSPGAFEDLEEALKMGADAVSGCPYNEKTYEDTKAHVDAIFELAKKYGVDATFHADFGDNIEDKRYRSIDYIIEKTEENNYQGRVTCGHMTSLSSVPPEVEEDTIKRLARAGISIVSLTGADLYLSGRADKRAERRGVLNPKPFIEGGVNMAYASNNIQNGFTPFGRGDLLLIGAIYEHAAQLGTVADQKMLLDMITHNAAKVLHVEESYGLAVGKNADLVVLGCKDPSDVFIQLPCKRYVIKRGRVIYRSERPELMGWAGA